MNDRDVTLVSKISGIVDGQENGRRILLSVKYNQINRMNLILLRALLAEQRKRGLFVTVDRPHQYMSYLLAINKVPQDDLVFLDIISRFSGERQSPSEVDTSGGSATPFQVNDLITLLEHGGSNGGQGSAHVDFGLMDFVMIDNLGAMLMYNELGDVGTFIQRYLKLIERYGTIFTAIVIDVRSQTPLYNMIRGMCQKEFLVTDDGDLVPMVAGAGETKGSQSSEAIAESAIIFKPSSDYTVLAHGRPTGAV
jgi:hypothetical protein